MTTTAAPAGEAPATKRVVAFVDGQNLFYAAKKAFGYTHPNYDVQALARHVVSQHSDWVLTETRFYTGIHDPRVNPFWNQFWTAKLGAMGHAGVKTFSRRLRYHVESVELPDGTSTSVKVGQEKGIDIRIALDLVRLVREKAVDIVLLFSQDQDLTEAVDEIKAIARQSGHTVRIVCAYPVGPGTTNNRGVDRTDWVRIDRTAYDACLDNRDYRPAAGVGATTT